MRAAGTQKDNDLAGITTGRIAFKIYTELEMPLECVEIAVSPVGGTSGLKAYVEQFETAMDMVPNDSLEYGQLASKYACAISEPPDRGYVRAKEFANEAVEIAKAHSDIDLEAWTTGRLGMLEAWYGHFREGFRLSVSAIELSKRADNYESLVHAIFWAGFCACFLGDMERARQFGASIKLEAERSRSDFRRGQAHELTSTVQIMTGEVDPMVISSKPPEKDGPPYWTAYAHQAAVAAEYGHIDEALEMVSAARARFDSIEHSGNMWPRRFASPLLARIGYLTRDIELLRYCNGAVETESGRFEQLMMHEIGAQLTLAFMAILENDQGAATGPYAFLKPFEQMMFGNVWAYPCSIDRVLGLLAAVQEMDQEAERHFQDGLKLCREGGCRPELAWTCHDYARFLIDRKRAGEASALIAEGLEIAEACGLAPLQESLRELSGRTGSGRKIQSSPAGLTVRELEVLKTVAGGLSNREIAESLFISQNTVIRHVSNIFAKTGCANRAEAAIWAERNHVLADG